MMSLPWKRRMSGVPGNGNRGSSDGLSRASIVRPSSMGSRRKFWGARMRRSASSAISSARRRARSESPPHAFAWIRQAMRRNRNCL